jgi:glycosyltransferase involved in cell wall biosynthesis
MAEADIVLVPSRDDTLPLVSLNALAAGKVLVCSRETGTSEYLESAVSGYVLAENTPAGIAATLSALLENPEMWPEIGRAARQVFDMRFSRSQFEARLLKYIDE